MMQPIRRSLKDMTTKDENTTRDLKTPIMERPLRPLTPEQMAEADAHWERVKAKIVKGISEENKELGLDRR